MADRNFLVRLKVTGLCGFVKNPNGRRVRVVLVNAFDHRASGGGFHHEPHEALLLVDNENVPQRPSKGADFKFVDEQDRRAVIQAFRLRGVDLSFTASPNGFSYEPRTEPECPDQDQAGFDWISKMSDVGAGVMRRDALVGTNSRLVLGRLLLTGGHFSTTSFRVVPADGAGTEIVRWQFRNSLGTSMGERRALAEETMIEFGISTSSPWGIVFREFGGNATTLFLEPDANNLVQLWLVNLPLLNVLGVFEGNREAPETHFLYYYDLSSGGQFFPHPVMPRCTRGGGGLTGPKCPTTQFADHADA